MKEFGLEPTRAPPGMPPPSPPPTPAEAATQAAAKAAAAAGAEGQHSAHASAPKWHVSAAADEAHALAPSKQEDAGSHTGVSPFESRFIPRGSLDSFKSALTIDSTSGHSFLLKPESRGSSIYGTVADALTHTASPSLPSSGASVQVGILHTFQICRFALCVNFVYILCSSWVQGIAHSICRMHWTQEWVIRGTNILKYGKNGL